MKRMLAILTASFLLLAGVAAQADALRGLGHQVQVRPHEGGLSALRRTADGWEGAADPRRDGVAKGE